MSLGCWRWIEELTFGHFSLNLFCFWFLASLFVLLGRTKTNIFKNKKKHTHTHTHTHSHTHTHTHTQTCIFSFSCSFHHITGDENISRWVVSKRHSNTTSSPSLLTISPPFVTILCSGGRWCVCVEG